MDRVLRNININQLGSCDRAQGLLRALTVVNNFSRECLAIRIDYFISVEEVVSVTQALKRIPGMIHLDNGLSIY